MYNKLSATQQKRRLLNSEDEPPDKKLVSDADNFIKDLARIQQNTQINLEEQLSTKSAFYKATEVVPLTNYTSGVTTLNEFNSVKDHSDEIEQLKSLGISNDDIVLFLHHKLGKAKSNHKNMNETVMNERIKYVLERLNQVDTNLLGSPDKGSRLMNEFVAAMKPASVETKLLKFAMENAAKNEQTLPHPMDYIKEIETGLMGNLSCTNVKKIRKKCRQLQRHIEAISPSIIREPPKVAGGKSFAVNSKWDVKESRADSLPIVERKLFTCKTLNYYTIKEGNIVKLGREAAESKVKLTVDEIRKIPKFENYEAGPKSKVLFLKNLANGVTENHLEKMLGNLHKNVTSINIMNGRMRGQAFIEVQNEELAETILRNCNGTLLKTKPVIIQFGKRK